MASKLLSGQSSCVKPWRTAGKSVAEACWPPGPSKAHMGTDALALPKAKDKVSVLVSIANRR
jgi:hypothetical protein